MNDFQPKDLFMMSAISGLTANLDADVAFEMAPEIAAAARAIAEAAMEERTLKYIRRPPASSTDPNS